ncbi:MAG: DUF1707 SHOCT-like domain-containing protein [Micromonosporaceae bacterium]
MTAPRNRPSGRRSAPYSGTGGTNPGLRVSDAERAEVADRLSKHYSDGRLDQATFDERLDQAMKAKTQSDLSGLLADLPGADEQAPPYHHRRRRGHRFLFLVLVVVIAAAAGETLARWSYIPWLLIGLLAFLWLRHGPWHHRRL